VSRRRKKGGSHWRKRQSTDPYFQKAKEEGYRARSAYKLIQIQRKFRILRKGQSILDLGAAPGSWSQVASKIVGDTGKVIAVDLLPIEPIPGVIALQGDIAASETQAQMIEAAGGQADVVLCDAAPNTSGIRERDHALSVTLACAAFDVAQRSLKAGGHLVVKVFEGQDLPQLIADLRRRFGLVKPHYPQATRRESREIYLVCVGFRALPEDRDRDEPRSDTGTQRPTTS
jgi:23S rRNA (uridine2552-2'-O)-methyltransferase